MYFSLNNSQSKYKLCFPFCIFCSVMYCNEVGGTKVATSARNRPNSRTRSLSKMQSGYWNKTATPPAWASHRKMLRAWTLNTNRSLHFACKTARRIPVRNKLIVKRMEKTETVDTQIYIYIYEIYLGIIFRLNVSRTSRTFQT